MESQYINLNKRKKGMNGQQTDINSKKGSITALHEHYKCILIAYLHKE
jgi:hypothetical protein